LVRSKKKPEADHKAQQERSYFMSLGLRPLGTVVGGAAMGYGIDYWMNNQVPVATLIFGILAVITAIVQLIRPFL
jgi:F0F1-type ATP synthase assembly protein I